MAVFQAGSGAQTGGSTSSTQIVPTGTPTSLYSGVTAVSPGSTETVLSYTVPAGITAYLLRVEVGGSNISTYDILVNGAVWARTRVNHGGSLTSTVQVGSSGADAVKLVAGDTLEVVTTNVRPYVGDYEARMQYTYVGA